MDNFDLTGTWSFRSECAFAVFRAGRPLYFHDRGPGAWHPEALAELPSPWPRVIPKASLVPKAFTGDGRQKPS
jgi:hypothetical protein